MLLTWLAAVVSASLLLWSQRRLMALRGVARSALARAQAIVQGAPERARPAAQGSAHVAELNELTIDLRGLLAAPSFVPRRCGRAALATGTLVALIQVARNLGVPEPSLAGPLLSFTCGAVAMLLCAMIGRAAEVEVSGLRQHWNSLIRRSGRDVAIGASGRSQAADHAQRP